MKDKKFISKRLPVTSPIYNFTKVRGFTIPSKKNNKLSFVRDGKHYIITDPKKQLLIKDIEKQLFVNLKTNIDTVDYVEPFYSRIIHLLGKGMVFVIFHISDNIRRDLDNMLTTILDCLVSAAVIEDDSTKYIRTITARKLSCDKGFEGCDVFISKI